MPACYIDGSGDAGIATFCGCGGSSFTPMRHGGMNGIEAADQPHQGRGECLSVPDAG
jgi:hypothetical protein